MPDIRGTRPGLPAAGGGRGRLRTKGVADKVRPRSSAAGTPLPAPLPASTDTDLDRLVARCAEGDARALRAVYDALSGLLLGVAIRILNDRRLAEEAVQDAFVQIWRNAARFDPAMGTARAWIVGMVRYRALDLRDAEGRAPRGAMEIGEADAAGAIGGEAPPAFEDRGALRLCLGELKDGPRRSILLAFVEGCSHPEIAERLGQPLGTVKSWILRGLGALRECMDR